MSDQIWYIYQNQQQLGPFEHSQVLQLLETGMINKQEAFLFKVGWKDWQPLASCLEELGLTSMDEGSSVQESGSYTGEQRRINAPRTGIEGEVIVHNNGQLVIGKGVNISATGIFVETTEKLFFVGERLKLSVRCAGLEKSFNVIARVVRYNSNKAYPVGYGLSFENLDSKIAGKIADLVKMDRKAS